ncbi:MAG: trypsin-like serine protease [Pseudolabrys sp.]
MRILRFVILFTIKMVCPASAMVGGAQEIPAAHTQPEVMFVGSSGNFCTGVAIARDLVLTAAHCVHAGDSYKLVELDFNNKPILKDKVAVARHPPVQSQDHASAPRNRPLMKLM